MYIEKIKSDFEDIEDGIYGNKNIKDSLAMIYHENSKFNVFSQRELGEQVAAFYNPYVTERSSQPFKHYPGKKKVKLNNYSLALEKDIKFFDIISGRRSKRDFDDSYAVSANELCLLLYHSYGINQKAKIDNVDGHLGLRPVPSPGGLYSLEIYLVLFKSHLENGIYHFRPDELALEQLKEGVFLEEVKELVYAEPYINMDNACGIIITTGVYERLKIKYGDRAYRFMLHESGFVAQNMSLILHALSLGSCMAGGYLDEKINQLLGLDGVFETVQNILIFGK